VQTQDPLELNCLDGVEVLLRMEFFEMRSIILWMLGVPIPVIILLWFFMK
jgi:hypothetical protein